MIRQQIQPIVFLDIDTLIGAPQGYSIYQALDEMKKQDFGFPPQWDKLVYPCACLNLAKFHLEFSPLYVISSNWCRRLSHSQMRQVLFRLKLTFVAVELHPNWRMPELSAPGRNEEVEAWLAKYPQPKRPILIIDNSNTDWALRNRELEKEKNAVLCDAGVGFVSSKLVEAQNLLRAQLGTTKVDVKIKPQKILYLDFDGVLHDEQVYFHPRRGICLDTPNRTLFEWMPILDDLLAPHAEVKIVLSTSWVRIRDFSFAKSQLSSTLQERVIGATFHSREMRKNEFVLMPRGVQIANDVFRRSPQAWFAIDDDHLGWPAWCRDNLIKTDGSRGISALFVQEAIQKMLERF